MSDLISFKEITGDPAELKELQTVLNSVPDFTRRSRGDEQGPANAEEVFRQVPEGIAPEFKVVYGLYFNHRMVGYIDIIKGYPDDRTAFIGNLVIAEDVQGAGLGSEAMKDIEKQIRTWEGCERIRIGILRTNDFVQNFWRKMGFRKISDSAHYESGSLKTKIFFMEKSLKAFSHPKSSGPSQQSSNNPNNNNRRPNKKAHHNRSNRSHNQERQQPHHNQDSNDTIDTSVRDQQHETAEAAPAVHYQDPQDAE